MNFGSRPFVYGEGRGHREAADLVEQEESCEEIIALFAVLPFANDCESEVEEEEEKGERLQDEGMVIELSQTGPPIRKLKPPIVTIGMCVCACVCVRYVVGVGPLNLQLGFEMCVLTV